MTNTANLRKPVSAAIEAAAPQVLSRPGGESLVDQIVRSVESRIDDKLLRTGARMPSIRMHFNVANMADSGVLRFLEREIRRT